MAEKVSCYYKLELMNAKLSEIRFHDLRYGHTTMLLEAGEDIKGISGKRCHSTITLNAGTYSYVRDKPQREASK